ncbi:hypothetical protein E2320_022695 [Naja naja]|nr:hypothetical protein E2320_022695 [Naja naja]
MPLVALGRFWRPGNLGGSVGLAVLMASAAWVGAQVDAEELAALLGIGRVVCDGVAKGFLAQKVGESVAVLSTLMGPVIRGWLVRIQAQSYEDIHKKLQRVEGALGKNTSELLEIARKVYVNRDKVEKKEKDARMHRRTELLAVALQEGMTMSPSKRGTPSSVNIWSAHAQDGGWLLSKLPAGGCLSQHVCGGGVPPDAAELSWIRPREPRRGIELFSTRLGLR